MSDDKKEDPMEKIPTEETPLEGPESDSKSDEKQVEPSLDD